MARHKRAGTLQNPSSRSTPDILPKILIDAGPLLALIATRDTYHQACVEIVRGLDTSFYSTLPAFSEAMYFAADRYGQPAVDALWKVIFDGLIVIGDLQMDDYRRMADLIRKYTDRPMDLADASLVAVAERLSLDTVFTVDRADFATYRLHGRKAFSIIGP
jgi:predicted nucleic acid-binding protein